MDKNYSKAYWLELQKKKKIEKHEIMRSKNHKWKLKNSIVFAVSHQPYIYICINMYISMVVWDIKYVNIYMHMIYYTKFGCNLNHYNH